MIIRNQVQLDFFDTLHGKGKRDNIVTIVAAHPLFLNGQILLHPPCYLSIVRYGFFLYQNSNHQSEESRQAQ